MKELLGHRLFYLFTYFFKLYSVQLRYGPGQWVQAHVGEVGAELLDIQPQSPPLTSDSPTESNRTPHTEVSKQLSYFSPPHTYLEAVKQLLENSLLL